MKRLEIKMHRGDYTKKKINILDKTDLNTNIDFNEIYITFKKSTKSQDFLFQKKLSTGEIQKNEDGSYTFEILPEDTNQLKFGDYVFDIELVCSVPKIKQTFLGNLYLLEEVTYALNEKIEERVPNE